MSQIVPYKTLTRCCTMALRGSTRQSILDGCFELGEDRVCWTDIKDLAKFRTFLGYYKHALVYAGTQEGIQSSTIRNSLVPNSSSRHELVREWSLSAGVSVHGASGAVGAKGVLPRLLQVSLAGCHIYEQRLESSRESPLLVYDSSTRSVWLVSELSMVLHMAHVYMSNSSLHTLD